MSTSTQSPQVPTIAVTTALLSIPPTYFVTQHARMLAAAGRFRAEVFPLASRVEDVPSPLLVRPALPDFVGGWDLRRRAAGIALRRQRDLILEAKPDLVHQHHAVWSTSAAGAAAELDVPLVTTVHGADMYTAIGGSRRPMARWHRRNVRTSFERSRSILAVSKHLAGVAGRAGADLSRLHVHYQGIDTAAFTPPASRYEGPTRVLYTGTFTHRKRVDLVIDAVAALQREGLETELHLVGDGPLRDELKAHARGLPGVHWHGKVSQPQVLEAMRRADTLILPSHDEAAGLVLLEAQSCGVPVVVTGGDGKSEMLADGRTGAVVPADADGSVIARAARPWLEAHTEDDKGTITECRSFVVQERSLAVSVEALASIYDELIA